MRRQAGWARWMLWPSLAGVAVFYAVPFVVVVYESLIDGHFTKQFVGLQNYINLFCNDAFRLAARNTAVFCGVAVPLSVGLALVLALALNTHIPAKGALSTVFLSPMVVPAASVVLIWQMFFDRNGVINSLFGLGAVDWLHSGWDKAVIVLLFLWKTLGYNAVIFTAALQTVPREVQEAARIDGAGRWRVFWHITVRYILPTGVFVTVLSLSSAFKIFREVYLLAGNYPSEGLYLLQHFMNNMFRTLDYTRMSTAAVTIFAVLGLVLAVLFWIEGRAGKDVAE